MTCHPGASAQSDADLVAASQTDPARFARLVDAYGESLLRYFARRVGPALAEDLAAETFLRAFRSRGTYRSVNPTALPWLYGIATNLLRDHARAEQHRLRAVRRVAERTTNDEIERVDDAIAATDQVKRVAEAVGKLADDARDVLVLVAVEGLSYDEAAEALGVPVGTIRSRLGRARAQLRGSLGETEPRGSLSAAQLRKGAFHV